MIYGLLWNWVCVRAVKLEPLQKTHLFPKACKGQTKTNTKQRVVNWSGELDKDCSQF